MSLLEWRLDKDAALLDYGSILLGERLGLSEDDIVFLQDGGRRLRVDRLGQSVYFVPHLKLLRQLLWLWLRLHLEGAFSDLDLDLVV